MLKKHIFILATVLVLLLSFTSIAFAGTWSPSVTWGEQQASYAPDWGNTSMYEYFDGSQRKVSPKARFRFVSSAITAIKNYKNINSYYYTFDISCTDQRNTRVSAYNSFYSTLPNPYYDIDDDPEPFGKGIMMKLK